MGWHGESLFTFSNDYFSYFSERVSKADSNNRGEDAGGLRSEENV